MYTVSVAIVLDSFLIYGNLSNIYISAFKRSSTMDFVKNAAISMAAREFG